MIEEHEVAEMRQQGDWKAYRRAVRSEAMAVCTIRKTAVLAHPDLAEKLTENPCAFSRPELWSGYVPSATVELKHSQRANDSPYRAQLVAIVAEAQIRDGKNYGVTGG